jgi:hypothetical protein
MATEKPIIQQNEDRKWHALRKDPLAAERQVLYWDGVREEDRKGQEGNGRRRDWEVGKLEPCPKTGSAGDAPEGLQGNKHKQICWRRPCG